MSENFVRKTVKTSLDEPFNNNTAGDLIITKDGSAAIHSFDPDTNKQEYRKIDYERDLARVDASAVHKKGNETIEDDKTFNGSITSNVKENAIWQRADITNYKFTNKGLTFRFDKVASGVSVIVTGTPTEDIKSGANLIDFNEESIVSLYAAPMAAGSITTGYCGNIITTNNQSGMLSVWHEPNNLITHVSYVGVTITSGKAIHGSAQYLSQRKLPDENLTN